MRAKDWYAILLFVLGLILAVLVYRANGEQIRLQWDPVDGVDGYMLYQSQKDSTFHYDIPITTAEYPDGKIPQDVTSLDIDLSGYADQDTRYRFVARSFRGDEFSADSNEVQYYVCLVPPLAATDLTGSYDKHAAMVHLQWSQPSEEQAWRTIDHWSVYYRIGDESEWQLVGTVESGGDLKIESAFNAVAEGEIADVEFVVVSHRRSGVFSENSQILTLNVDRRGVPPIQNLRINIEFPVI